MLNKTRRVFSLKKKKEKVIKCYLINILNNIYYSLSSESKHYRDRVRTITHIELPHKTHLECPIGRKTDPTKVH